MNISPLTASSFDATDGRPAWRVLDRRCATPSFENGYIALNVLDLEDLDELEHADFIGSWASDAGLSLHGIPSRRALVRVFELVVLAAGVELGIGPALLNKYTDIIEGRPFRGKLPNFHVALDYGWVMGHLVNSFDGPFTYLAAFQSAVERRLR